VYIPNLVTKHGQTTGFSVHDHVSEIERFVGAPFLDYVLYNCQIPSKKVARRYAKEKAYLVKFSKRVFDKATYKAVSGNFLGEMVYRNKADLLPAVRSLIRHDSEAVGRALIELYNHSRNL
jgi:2-phospho-L-lactate transferase/gluconeogenesis factor (CofD/UPF0052 family)